jgi:hypothetical protein
MGVSSRFAYTSRSEVGHSSSHFREGPAKPQTHGRSGWFTPEEWDVYSSRKFRVRHSFRSAIFVIELTFVILNCAKFEWCFSQ